MSASREATVIASEPLFMQMNFANGVPLERVWPISRRSRLTSSIWLIAGVMMFAMTCGWFIASRTICGA